MRLNWQDGVTTWHFGTTLRVVHDPHYVLTGTWCVRLIVLVPLHRAVEFEGRGNSRQVAFANLRENLTRYRMAAEQLRGYRGTRK